MLRTTTRVLSAALTLVALAGPLPAAGVDLEAAKRLSRQHCEKCHGATGKGDGRMLKRLQEDVVPVDWTDKAKMAKWSDEELAVIIKDGGKASGYSKVMPSYKKKLSAAEIADLVGYIRSLAQ